MKIASHFRAIADKYNKTFVIKTNNQETDRVYNFIKPCAERGLYSTKYFSFLSTCTIKELEKSGIRVTYFCERRNYYQLEW